MNLKEGTRRLALLLGVIGAIAGGFASYVELQTVLPQRATHRHFEQLANSEVVKKERKTLQATPDFIPDPSTKTPKPGSGQDLPPGWSAAPIKPGSSSEDGPWNHYAAPQQKAGHGSGSAQPELDRSTSIPFPSKVSKGGIETINWSHDYGIASIETEDGQTLYPTAAPSAWLYVLIALFPVLGFVVPWGAIRAAVWVGAGFVAKSV